MKKIEIVVIANDKEFINKAAKEWEKYFQIELIIIEPHEFDSIKKKKIDILFIENNSKDIFKIKYHKMFKDRSHRFNLIAFKKEQLEDDKNIFKKLYDRIVYTHIEELAILDTIAILRRHWNANFKVTTIIYKSIVADFLENKIFVDGTKVSLTSKETSLLKFLLLNKNNYISKNELFRKVWNVNDYDRTRVLDQIIFKLKNKIGRNYFHISRKEGIKII
ncbi:winged helix-turn-helix domain-containing protein [Candidatus Mycoplasma mahonii]|uniref:winged helix-turn-helix domain-containing protein n=1 Tax=Candidatus Mycoplasma mahonii TaxID=3004105 RepID=UPI0026F16544|nr:winged helix-turn-helix domain-containing protein [Candidatus Mycoplasma mahonii]WKX02728.1 winged helix-turn-helix domain-containing protein [Candidatus Mycoplasma mahonii]